MKLDYFKNMDSLNKFYWYGLLFADGYNHYNNGVYRFGLELQERDKDIIEKFHKELNFDVIIQNINKKIKNKIHNYCRIQKVNNEFSEHLFNIGINHTKTKQPELIKMSNEEFRHFMRGFTDGDGCIYISKINNNNRRVVSWGLTLHNSLVKFIKNKILELTGIYTCVQKHWRTPYISTLSINGLINVHTFLNWLYNNTGDLHLNRKYEKYLLIENYFNSKIIKDQKDCTSKYRGVCFIKKNKKYLSTIKVNNKNKYLGSFSNEKDAAIAYNNAAIIYRGKKAILNKIDDVIPDVQLNNRVISP